MKQLHKILIILILLIFIIEGCCSKDSSVKAYDLTGQVWIYDSPSLPDSIKNFTDNFLIFDSTGVTLNDDNIGEFTITHDTLRIFQTSFVLQKGGKYQKEVSNQFVGLIIKADTNQIALKRINGYFPIKYKNSYGNFDESLTIRLTNQKCKKKENVHFEYVSIASTTCYGSCPNYNLELDKKGNLKFHCPNYCKKIGSYEGKLKSSELRKIQDIISYLSLKNDSTIFITPMDAPEAVIKINVNNKEFYFRGYSGEFQYKMQELMSELYLIVEKSKLKKTSKKLNFRAKLKGPSFLPPKVN